MKVLLMLFSAIALVLLEPANGRAWQCSEVNIVSASGEVDHWVYGEVKSLSSQSASDAIYGEYEKLEVKLKVKRSFPSLRDAVISFRGNFYPGQDKSLLNNRNWIIGLHVTKLPSGEAIFTSSGNHPCPVPTFFEVDAALNAVKLFSKPTPFTDAWRLLVDIKNSALSGGRAEFATLSHWQSNFMGVDLMKNLLALIFFSTLIEPPPIGRELVEALIRHKSFSRASKYDAANYEDMLFIKLSLELLALMVDETSAALLLDHYRKMADIPRSCQGIFARELFRVFSSSHLRSRRGMLQSLISSMLSLSDQSEIDGSGGIEHHYTIREICNALTHVEGNDIDQVLLWLYERELSSSTPDIQALVSLVIALAQRGNGAIAQDLNDFASRNLSSKLFTAGFTDQSYQSARSVYVHSLPHQMMMEDFASRLKSGDYKVLYQIHYSLRAQDRELFLPIYKRLEIDNIEYIDYVVTDIALYLADPSLLPLLKRIAKINTRGAIFDAIYASGDMSLAKTLAHNSLDETLSCARTESAILEDPRNIILFLGNTGDQSLVSEFIEYTQPNASELVVNRLGKANSRRCRAESYIRYEGEDLKSSGHLSFFSKLKKDSAVVLGKFGGHDATLRLRELYRNDPDSEVRFIAALGLWNQKDDSVGNLNQLFEGETTDVNSRRWPAEGVVAYFDNSEMAKSLFKRQWNEIDSEFPWWGFRRFFQKYEREFLSHWLALLESSSNMLRIKANSKLEFYTNYSVGFVSDDLPGHRHRKIEKWRLFLDNYFATFSLN